MLLCGMLSSKLSLVAQFSLVCSMHIWVWALFVFVCGANSNASRTQRRRAYSDLLVAAPALLICTLFLVCVLICWLLVRHKRRWQTIKSPSPANSQTIKQACKCHLFCWVQRHQGCHLDVVNDRSFPIRQDRPERLAANIRAPDGNGRRVEVETSCSEMLGMQTAPGLVNGGALWLVELAFRSEHWLAVAIPDIIEAHNVNVACLQCGFHMRLKMQRTPPWNKHQWSKLRLQGGLHAALKACWCGALCQDVHTRPLGNLV